jgi:hypothetical protein
MTVTELASASLDCSLLDVEAEAAMPLEKRSQAA